MKRYVIERDIAGVGGLNGEQLKGAAATSNAALAKLSGKAQWVQSFVVDDKTFCIYLAADESAVQEHAKAQRFPSFKGDRSSQRHRSDDGGMTVRRRRVPARDARSATAETFTIRRFLLRKDHAC